MLALIGLAFYELLRHIDAEYPINIALAAGGILFLLYGIYSPTMRR